MKSIVLKKIELVEIEVLQKELINFITHRNATLLRDKHTDRYFDSILLLDIATKLVWNFRDRIEKTTKQVGNLKLTVSEAVTLLQCCNSVATLRNDYENYCMNKIAAMLHQELTNLI
ncbi:MAG TPA: hypothetical protein VF581_07830 [Flavobacterium sp.]|jgi:hypothetical protein